MDNNLVWELRKAYNAGVRDGFRDHGLFSQYLYKVKPELANTYLVKIGDEIVGTNPKKIDRG